MQSVKSLPSFYQPESVVLISGAQGTSLGHLLRYQIKNDTHLKKIKKMSPAAFCFLCMTKPCWCAQWDAENTTEFKISGR